MHSIFLIFWRKELQKPNFLSIFFFSKMLIQKAYVENTNSTKYIFLQKACILRKTLFSLMSLIVQILGKAESKSSPKKAQTEPLEN